MHLVIENILNRKNKKVPVSDGRKIALVLFGGAMAGVRGGGALFALNDLGLLYAFDEIYVTSAGFPNVSYMLSDDRQRGLSVYYQDLVNNRFINFWRIWKVVNVEYLMSVFKESKRIRVEKILEGKTKVFVQLRNVDTGKIEYLEIHNFSVQGFFKLLEASISIPYLHPGSVKINGGRYMDAVGFLKDSSRHVRRAIDSGATDILVIYNRADQRTHDFDGESIFEIVPPTGWKMSRFEKNSEVLKNEAQKMGELVKESFGEKGTIEIIYN